MKRARFDSMIFAALYAFIFPTVVGCVAGWMSLSDKNVGYIKDWQTLIAGVIAILAAFLGGGFVYYQTTEASRQHDALLTRRHLAARSVLPLALSGLVEYADRVAESLEGLRPLIATSGSVGTPPTPFAVPDFGTPNVERLRDVIESASEDVADRVARVISDMQILDSRLRSVADALRPGSSTLILEMNLDDYSINAGTISARCSELFSYARRDTEEAPGEFPKVENLLSALRQFGFDEWSHARMFEMAQARAERFSSGH